MWWAHEASAASASEPTASCWIITITRRSRARSIHIGGQTQGYSNPRRSLPSKSAALLANVGNHQPKTRTKKSFEVVAVMKWNAFIPRCWSRRFPAEKVARAYRYADRSLLPERYGGVCGECDKVIPSSRG